MDLRCEGQTGRLAERYVTSQIGRVVIACQNTQNRDAAAMQMKLNELIRTNQNARNSLLTLKDLTEDQLRKLKATFAAIAVDRQGLPGELREAREDLAQAGEEIEQAETKLARAEIRTAALLDDAQSPTRKPTPSHGR